MTAGDGDIGALVYRTCLLLDAERFDDYLALCSADFRYRVKADSPELGKEMTWLDLDRNELADLLENVANHVRLPGRFPRQATVYTIERDDDGAAALVTTSLIVVYTDLDGVSRLFASGRYLDTVALGGPAPQLASRTVWLDTRDLGPGSHVPL